MVPGHEASDDSCRYLREIFSIFYTIMVCFVSR